MNGASERGVYAAVKDALETAPSAGDGRGLWDRLSMLVDPAEIRPQLAPDVEVKEFHLRWGNDYAMIANPRDLLHYQLEPGELELLPLMDGTRTVKEIVVERFRESGDMELSGVADLVQTLRVGNFLTTPFVDVRAAVRRSIDTADRVRTTDPGVREDAHAQLERRSRDGRVVLPLPAAMGVHPVGRGARAAGGRRRVPRVLVLVPGRHVRILQRVARPSNRSSCWG